MAHRAGLSSSAMALYMVNTKELLKPRLARFSTVSTEVNRVDRPLYSCPSSLMMMVLMANGPMRVATR